MDIAVKAGEDGCWMSVELLGVSRAGIDESTGIGMVELSSGRSVVLFDMLEDGLPAFRQSCEQERRTLSECGFKV